MSIDTSFEGLESVLTAVSAFPRRPYTFPVEHTAHITWAYEHAFEALTNGCRDLALQIAGFLQTFNHHHAAQIKSVQNRILSDDPAHLRRKGLHLLLFCF